MSERAGIADHQPHFSDSGSSSPPPIRAVCELELRPCKRTSCPHHLHRKDEPAGRPSDGKDGRRMPIRVVAHTEETCTLDVAARGAQSRDHVGVLLGLGGRRVGQIEDRAKVKLAARERVDAALLTVPGIGWAWERHPGTTHAVSCVVNMRREVRPLVGAALSLAASDWPGGVVLEREWENRGELSACTVVVRVGDEGQIASVARAWKIKPERRP